MKGTFWNFFLQMSIIKLEWEKEVKKTSDRVNSQDSGDTQNKPEKSEVYAPETFIHVIIQSPPAKIE